MTLAFDIVNIRNSQFLQSILGRDGNGYLYRSLYPADGLVQLLGKGKIFNRLYHIVHGIHLVTAHCILNHIGDKHDDYFVVKRPDFLSGRHSIHKPHLNIH